jgi:hypothetical protein
MFARPFVVLFLAWLGGWATAGMGAQRSTSEILEELRQKADAADMALFEVLGKRADREAFEAMKEGLALLYETTNLYKGYRSLRHFRGTEPELERRVITYLDQGLRSSEQPAGMLPRARALAAFGSVARKESERHIDKHPDALVRSFLLGGILEELVEEGGLRNLERVLDWFRLSFTGNEQALTEALRSLYEPKHQRRTLRKLTDKRRTVAERLPLLRGFAPIPGGAVDELVVALVEAADEPEMRSAAIEVLGDRGGEDQASMLKTMAKKGKPEVRASALEALLRLPNEAAEAEKKVRRLAKSRKAKERRIAAQALDRGGVGPVDVLGFLLEDPDAEVRQAAFASALERREKVVVAVLIERLAHEQEPLLSEVHRVLRLLTGEDFGNRPHGWRSFWKKKGATFQLPTAGKARSQYRERESELGRRERDSLYGLKIEGDRIAFLLDVSDSMKGFSETRRDGKRLQMVSRLDILREQFAGALRGLPDGKWINLYFFGSTVESFRPELVELDEDSRAEALRFASRVTTLGATALYDALEQVFDDRKIETIYLVSDGRPEGGKIDDPDRLLAAVRKWNRRREVRIHCVCLYVISFPFLEELASSTGGQYKHIPPARSR